MRRNNNHKSSTQRLGRSSTTTAATTKTTTTVINTSPRTAPVRPTVSPRGLGYNNVIGVVGQRGSKFVGDMNALATMSPKELERLGLLPPNYHLQQQQQQHQKQHATAEEDAKSHRRNETSSSTTESVTSTASGGRSHVTTVPMSSSFSETTGAGPLRGRNSEERFGGGGDGASTTSSGVTTTLRDDMEGSLSEIPQHWDAGSCSESSHGRPPPHVVISRAVPVPSPRSSMSSLLATAFKTQGPPLHSINSDHSRDCATPHPNILHMIGQTPLIRLQRIAPPEVDVYVKCEQSNPTGSLQDRLALGIIDRAEKNGQLAPGQTVIEASTGNTGVALAMVCSVRGYPFVCVTSDAYTVEQRKLMRFLGARVIVMDRGCRENAMVAKAQQLASQHGFFYASQYEQEVYADIHEMTTGQELVQAFEQMNRPLHHFFMSYGTGATVLGVSRALSKTNMGTQIHLCEPASAAIMRSHVSFSRSQHSNSSIGSESSFWTMMDGHPHPAWSPHLFHGWAADFVAQPIAAAEAERSFHYVRPVKSSDAIYTARLLAMNEGIMTGMSGGGILAAALKLTRSCAPGTTVVCMLPDTAERCINTALFEDIPVDMTPEERKLAESVSNLHLTSTTLSNNGDGSSSTINSPNNKSSALLTSARRTRTTASILPPNTDQLFDL